MKRILLSMALLTAMLVISQSADARRRIKRRKAPVVQNVMRKSELKEFAPIIFGADSMVMDSPLLTMKEMGMHSGAMIYVCSLPEVKAPGMLTLNDCHDYAQVFIDDEYIGKIDCMQNGRTIEIPPVHDGQELKILVDAIGHSNGDAPSTNFVGLSDQIILVADIDGNELTLNLKCWTILTIPDGYDNAVKALVAVQSTEDMPNSSETSITSKGSGYYRYNVVFSRSGDIFLNMGNFGRGEVFVNGNPLGYFSNTGSVQTLPVLRRYLKRGFNEVLVFDVVGPLLTDKTPALQVQDKP